MSRMRSVNVDEVSVKPMEDDMAAVIRPICTVFGLHRSCPFKVCRRAKACATRNVVCYQAMEEEMKPIVRSIMARKTFNALASGENLDEWLAPATAGDMRRRLAWEDEEIARIEAGAYGNDDSLTHYQLWLKKYAAQDSRDRAAAKGREAAPDATSPEIVADRQLGGKLA